MDIRGPLAGGIIAQYSFSVRDEAIPPVSLRLEIAGEFKTCDAGEFAALSGRIQLLGEVEQAVRVQRVSRTPGCERDAERNEAFAYTREIKSLLLVNVVVG
jgi:hypothetical protein